MRKGLKNAFFALLTVCFGLGFAGCTNAGDSQHDHVWDGGKITTPSTCYSEGVKTYSCTVDGCEETKTETIEMIPHAFDEGVVTKEPTCKDTGSKTFTCTREGCGQKKEEILEKTAHTFDEGVVTKEPTCKDTGIKTFTCSRCGEGKEEILEKTAHEFDDGVVTLAPTSERAGEKTYTCKICGETKTEVIPASGPAVSGSINYFENFSTAGNNGWVYGYATDYQWSGAHKDSFKFNPLTAVNENEWGGVPGVIIKRDWILSENGKCAAIGYVVKEGEDALKVKLTFTHSPNSEVNGVSPTRFAIRLLVVGADGYTKSMQYLYDNTSSFSFTREVEVEYGDTVYAVLFKEADGWEQGRLQIEMEKVQRQYVVTPTPPLIHPNHGNFYYDFSTYYNNNWVYGYATDYQWSGEHQDSFTFNPLTAVNEDEWGGVPGVIIKRDWILSEGGKNAAIGYVVREGQNALRVKMDFTHAPDSETDGVSPTRFAIRLLVVGADGYTKSMQYLYDNTSSFSFTREVAVEYGDTVYAVLFKEADGWEQGRLQITVDKIDPSEIQQPEIPEEVDLVVGDFYKDFSTAGNNGWVYGHATDYQWNGEHQDSFTFNPLTAVSENEWGGVDGVIIKNDWILSEGGKNAAIGYVVKEGESKLNVKTTFTHAPASETDGVSPTRFAIRVLVVGSDGYTKTANYIYKGTSSFEAEQQVEVTNGDTVYVVLFREAEGWEQGKLQITVDKVLSE